MPSWLPEGDTSYSTDNELRSLQKWCSLLYTANGDKGPAAFPEGSRPLPTDNEVRLLEKIDALRS